MKRYNINTDNQDLIQIDLNDAWTIQEGETALLRIIRLETPKSTECTLVVNKNDLTNLRNNINRILNDEK